MSGCRFSHWSSALNSRPQVEEVRGKVAAGTKGYLMCKGAYNLIPYLCALAFLIAAPYWQTNLAVFAMAFLFAVWDLWFVFHTDSFAGRDTKSILEHARDAETLMSYFIGFYAVVFGVVFTEADNRKAFLLASTQAHVPLAYVGAPLVLACIPMLFIPVQFDAAGISKGVKALMFINIYFEKIVVFTFVHDILRISSALSL